MGFPNFFDRIYLEIYEKILVIIQQVSRTNSFYGIQEFEIQIMECMFDRSFDYDE